TQNRAQLRLEDFDILETKADRAPAEERVQLVGDIYCARSQLIAAEIKCSDNQRIGPDALCDSSIGLILLVLCRQSSSVQIQELSAIKSDSLRAVGFDSIDVFREFDVCRKHNVTAVARSRGCLAQFFQFRRDFGSSCFDLCVLRKCFRRRIDDQMAVVPIKENALA